MSKAPGFFSVMEDIKEKAKETAWESRGSSRGMLASRVVERYDGMRRRIDVEGRMWARLAFDPAPRRYRILFILPYLEAAGTERHTLSLAQAFQSHHAMALLSPEGPLLAEFRRLGVTHASFPRLEHAGLKGISIFRRALKGMLVQHRPDLIHIHAAPELGLLVRTVDRRIPIVVTIHGFHGPRAEANYPLAARVSRLAWTKRVIAVSHADARWLQRGGLKPPALQVVHNGIPNPTGEPIRWHEELGWDPDTPIVGAVGRLEEPKGFHVLLEAFARLDPAAYPQPPRLVMVGSGTRLEPLKAQAADLGIGDRVHFTGYLPDSHRAFPGFHVAVVPSLQDALPLVTLEAMAHGRPVVASSAGGLPEMVVDGETGLVCPPGDVGQLAAALTLVLGNPERARKMGEKGKQRFHEHFSLEQMVVKTLEVYNDALHNGRA